MLNEKKTKMKTEDFIKGPFLPKTNSKNTATQSWRFKTMGKYRKVRQN